MIARKYMQADLSASKKTESLQIELEASKAEIERLRVDLAHSGRRMLEIEMAQRAKETAELREEMHRLARDFKSLKGSSIKKSGFVRVHVFSLWRKKRH